MRDYKRTSYRQRLICFINIGTLVSQETFSLHCISRNPEAENVFLVLFYSLFYFILFFKSKLQHTGFLVFLPLSV